jgi:hypothetical protein
VLVTAPLSDRHADELELRRLCAGSAEFLTAVYRAEDGLFPFSTRLRGTELVNDFDHPQTRRYTITSLVGLSQALPPDELAPLVDTFAERWLDRLDSPADLGLFSLVYPEALAGVREAARSAASSQLNMQDLAWMLWGASANGDEPTARHLFERMLGDFVEPRSGLPRHSVKAYRRRVLSFGSLVYFLRSTWEYGRAFGDERALELYRSGVAKALALQGPQGEWPWMIDARSGRAFDRYPVFAVHQDSMAPLFLLPALDDGLPGVEAALDRSVRWVLGENELGVPMFVEEPVFFAYRSIERRESFPKARRYARFVGRCEAVQAPAGGTWLNDECRSYHPGWILFAWSSRLAR